MSSPQESEQDWGDSSGAKLAHAREENTHKRFERGFQLKVLALLIILVMVAMTLDMFAGSNYTKDMLPAVIPVFTFVLGKMGSKE